MDRLCGICHKSFKYRQSLWRHKKTCTGGDNHAGSEVFHSINTDRSRRNLQYKSADNDTKSHYENALFGNVNTVRSPSVTKTDMTKYVWKKGDKIDDSSTLDDGNIRIHESSRADNSKDDGEESGIGSMYVWKTDNQVTKNHSSIFPRDIRALIVGKSGSGKTTLLMHLLLEPDMLDYDTLTVCGNSLHQPEYRILDAGFSNNFSKVQTRFLFQKQRTIKRRYGGVDGLIQEYKQLQLHGRGGVNTRFLEDVADIPDPSDHDPRRKNLLVLDDIMLGPQNKAEAYYTRGRHNNVDTIYIAQNYFRLPRQTVRENTNLIMLFNQDTKNLSHIYHDHCTDISYGEFSDFCNDVWSKGKHHFVTINLNRPGAQDGKYRRNLGSCWSPPMNLSADYNK